MQPYELLAVDPGAHMLGWAGFNNGALVSCGYRKIEDWRYFSTRMLVVEIPQVYARRVSRGDPNDLIDVAVGAGIAIGGTEHERVTRVRPHAWKKNTPKNIHGQRIKDALNASELRTYLTCTRGIPASLRHNVIDSIGIGLWTLERMR